MSKYWKALSDHIYSTGLFECVTICGKKDGRIWAISQSEKNALTSKKIYEKEENILESKIKSF